MSWWPWGKRDYTEVDEARAALTSGKAMLQRAQETRAEAQAVGRAAEATRRHNHFGEAVTATMRGK